MDKEKPFLTLAEQCRHLEDNKSVIIEDVEKAKETLYNTNYYNIVTCGKVKFATNVSSDNEHIYKNSYFEDWEKYFIQDCDVSEYLMRNLIRFERKLNSRVAYHISELIKQNTLTSHAYNELMQIVKNNRAGKGYSGSKTWAHVTHLTFSETKNVLLSLHRHHENIYHKIVQEYSFLRKKKRSQVEKQLNELINLRNNVFHFRPINIYLIYGKKPTNIS